MELAGPPFCLSRRTTRDTLMLVPPLPRGPPNFPRSHPGRKFKKASMQRMRKPPQLQRHQQRSVPSAGLREVRKHEQSHLQCLHLHCITQAITHCTSCDKHSWFSSNHADRVEWNHCVARSLFVNVPTCVFFTTDTSRLKLTNIFHYQCASGFAQ